MPINKIHEINFWKPYGKIETYIAFYTVLCKYKDILYFYPIDLPHGTGIHRQDDGRSDSQGSHHPVFPVRNAPTIPQAY